MILIAFCLIVPLALMGWKMCAISALADEQMEAQLHDKQKEMRDNAHAG